MKKNNRFYALASLIVTVTSTTCIANDGLGNTRIDSFQDSKKMLMRHVYSNKEIARTIYCDLSFDSNKKIDVPASVTTTKYEHLLKKVEFDHIVPISMIGQSYSEWRDGHPDCVDSKGKPFKGRGCAGKVNMEYRLAEADAYNLFPSVGAVNRLRSNFAFGLLPNHESDFGSCLLKLDAKTVEPPEIARGTIARASLYMHENYKKYRMSSKQFLLFTAWDKQYPVTKKECSIARKIESFQGNENKFVKAPCKRANLW